MCVTAVISPSCFQTLRLSLPAHFSVTDIAATHRSHREGRAAAEVLGVCSLTEHHV